MYTLAMTIDHHYWKHDHKHHCARQVEKEALESHSWKQEKVFTSGPVVVSQNKVNLSLAASFAKNSSFKLSLSSTPKKQPNSLWVDLSSKLANNGKLTSDEYTKVSWKQPVPLLQYRRSQAGLLSQEVDHGHS